MRPSDARQYGSGRALRRALSPITRTQAGCDDPRGRRCQNKACHHDHWYPDHLLIAERGQCQHRNEADAENHGIRHVRGDCCARPQELDALRQACGQAVRQECSLRESDAESVPTANRSAESFGFYSRSTATNNFEIGSTDLQLSGLGSGWDVAEAFRALSHKIPVIYTGRLACLT